jgi:glycosyltransferase involved in cell wall biosynthesis
LSSDQSNPILSATVVICTRNRAGELDQCLQSVARLHHPDYEVLVVENGVPDGRTRALAEGYGVRYLNSPRVGLSRARNDGARFCKTDLVAFLDDDSRPHEDWLDNIAQEFCDPSVMAVAGNVIPRTSENNTVRPHPENHSSDRRNRRVIDLQTPDWFALANFGGIGMGCNMCFRRMAFELWDGFDERLGRGALLDSAEEHFSFFQLVLLGYRCVYTPYAVVQHPTPESIEELRRAHRHNIKNAIAYIGLLWAEFPETRGRLLRLLWSRGFGERKRARAARGAPPLSFSEQLRAIAAGLRLFSTIPRATPRARVGVRHSQKTL